ncbi:hypothetical protein AVEN_73436-1 [Araneus ventricosus]|uniref:Uncharacterized protein n=1 Tax=Araneus ventricosus TaxID=182803 RepID=A0A4Y2GJV0_ARAVE|nr:hypothetical protein AVEN_73436-1 [Araneus ventricosus]
MDTAENDLLNECRKYGKWFLSLGEQLPVVDKKTRKLESRTRVVLGWTEEGRQEFGQAVLVIFLVVLANVVLALGNSCDWYLIYFSDIRISNPSGMLRNSWSSCVLVR